MIKLYKLTIFVAIFSMLFSCSVFAESKISSGKFKTIFEFEDGDAANQLLWIKDVDGTPNIGTLQGPMAFVTMANGDLWVADTQNARFCLFAKDGKRIKEIDLIKLGKEAGLSNPPAMADFCVSNGKIIAADAASNAVLEINPETNKMRVFNPAANGKGSWFQITHVYTDDKERIYVDDIVNGKITVLDKDGVYLGENVAACIAVSPKDSSMACIHYLEETEGESEISVYQLATNTGFDTPWKVASIVDNNDTIMYVSIIGIDKGNNIYVLYETEYTRYYNIYGSDGKLLRTIETSPINSSYNPARPDWIDESGNIYTVNIQKNVLRIMKLVNEE